MLEIKWRSDGRGGAVYEDGDFVGFVGIYDWWEPETRESRAAWVVDFMVPGVDIMQRASLELDAEPTADQNRIDDLAQKAKSAVELGPPATPAPFGYAPTGLVSNAEVKELLQLTNYALESAAGRVMGYAQEVRADAVMRLNVAVAELMAWLRAVDELGAMIWRDRLTPADREAASQAADTFISSPDARPNLVAAENNTRQANGQPYSDWTIALLGVHIGGWLPREEFKGFRWLAGKMLHHGPLSAVELFQWRGGEQPRWKWRRANDIFPPPLPEERTGQRRDYDAEIAGKDVLGSLRYNDLAHGVERLFLPLLS